jgi:hypothetical protein
MRIGLTGGSISGGGAPSAFNPLSLSSLTAMWTSDTNYAAADATWTDRKNSRILYQAGHSASRRPSQVATVFGTKAALRFDGSDDALIAYDNFVSDFISAATGYVYVLCKVRSIATADAASYLNDTIWVDSSALCGLHLHSANGIVGQNYDTNTDNTAYQAVSNDTRYVFRWRHSGGTVGCRIDSGTEQTASSGNTDGTISSDVLVVGCRYTGGTGAGSASIDVGAILTFNAALSAGDDANIMAWLNAYGT